MKSIKKSMEKLCASAAMAMILIAASAPASAAIYTYTMTDNRGVLVLDMDARTGSWTGGSVDQDGLDVRFNINGIRYRDNNFQLITVAFENFDDETKLRNLSLDLSGLDGFQYQGGAKAEIDEKFPADGILSAPQFGSDGMARFRASWSPTMPPDVYNGTVATSTVNTDPGSSPVSEPGAFGLMALGLGGLMIARRRRRAPGLAGA